MKGSHRSCLRIHTLAVLFGIKFVSDWTLLRWRKIVKILRVLKANRKISSFKRGSLSSQFAFFILFVVDLCFFFRIICRLIRWRDHSMYELIKSTLWSCALLFVICVALKLVSNTLVWLDHLSGLRVLNHADSSSCPNKLRWVLFWIMSHRLFCFIFNIVNSSIKQSYL